MWFHITLCVILISALKAQDIDEDTLKLFLRHRCEKNGNAKAFEELEDSVEIFQACVMQRNSAPAANLEEAIDSACNIAPPINYNCIEKLLDKVEPCLDSEEKYFPEFLLGALNATVEYQCRDGAQKVVDQIDNLLNSKCRDKFQNLVPVIIGACSSKFKLFKDLEAPDFVLRESYLCSDLQTAKDCAIETISEMCEDDNVTKFTEESFKPLLIGCSS